MNKKQILKERETSPEWKDFEAQSRRSIKSFPDGELFLFRADTELSHNQYKKFLTKYDSRGQSPASAYAFAKKSRR